MIPTPQRACNTIDMNIMITEFKEAIWNLHFSLWWFLIYVTVTCRKEEAGRRLEGEAGRDTVRAAVGVVKLADRVGRAVAGVLQTLVRNEELA